MVRKDDLEHNIANGKLNRVRKSGNTIIHFCPACPIVLAAAGQMDR